MLQFPSPENGDGGKADFPVRRNRLDRVPVVERGLESLDREARVSRLVQPPDQLLRLSAEHAAADQVEATRRLVEPNLLEGLGSWFSGVMAPAHREEPFRCPAHDLEALGPAGQVPAAWLGANTIVELQRSTSLSAAVALLVKIAV